VQRPAALDAAGCGRAVAPLPQVVEYFFLLLTRVAWSCGIHDTGVRGAGLWAAFPPHSALHGICLNVSCSFVSVQYSILSSQPLFFCSVFAFAKYQQFAEVLASVCVLLEKFDGDWHPDVKAPDRIVLAASELGDIPGAKLIDGDISSSELDARLALLHADYRALGAGVPPRTMEVPGRLQSSERAQRHVQPLCRGGKDAWRRKACRSRPRHGGGPPAWCTTHGRGHHPPAQRTCARWVGRPTRRTGGRVRPTAAQRGT